MTELADIHDIVEHLRKHTLGGEHDEEQVVDALVRVMDRRPDLRKLLKPADVAYLRTKKGAKGRYAFEESQHPRGQPENAGEFATNPGGGAKKLSNEHKVGERSAKFAVKLAKRNGTPLEPIVLERLSEQLKGHPQERELLEQVRAVTQGQEPAQQQPAATPSKVETDKVASIGMSLDKPDSPALNTPQAVAADKAIREAIGGQAMLTYPGKGFVQIGNDEFMAVVSVRDVGGRGEVGTYIPVITPKSDDGHWQVGQTGISGGRAYRLPADATPEEIAMAVRANMPRKENGKLQITRDESFHLEELTRKLREARQQRRAAQYARDWNDLRAAGRNVSRDEITAAASDLAGTGVYVAWNASDDAPGWEAVPASVADALMGRYAREGEPGGGVMFGGEVHTGDDEQERIHLIADILHGVYGDDVMSMFDDTGRYSREPEGRYAKWGPEEAAQHPRGEGGRFIKRGTHEAATATREKVRDALKGGGTAKELAGHLDLLTVKQLAEIKKEYQISASGRNKAELVAKLAERLSKGRGDGKAPEGDSPSYADWGKGERESRKEKPEDAKPPAEPEAVGEKPQEGAKGKPAVKEPHEMTKAEYEAKHKFPQVIWDEIKANATHVMRHMPGQLVTVSPDPSGKEGMMRVTRWDHQGPVGHTDVEEDKVDTFLKEHTYRRGEKIVSVTGGIGGTFPSASYAGAGFRVDSSGAKGVRTFVGPEESLDWMTNRLASGGYNSAIGDVPEELQQESGIKAHAGEKPIMSHSIAVERALSEGKPVPDAVLADYPDLAAKYGKGEQPAKPAAEKPIQEKLKEVFQGEPKEAAGKSSEATTAISALYDRAGKPGLTDTAIDAAFNSANLASMKMDDLKKLAWALDVAPQKHPKEKLIELMKVNVANRAGAHARAMHGLENPFFGGTGKKPAKVDPKTHSPKIAASFDKLNDNGRNFVSIAKLRAEHPELSKDEFDKAVFHLRKEEGFTASALEGRDGATKEELAGAIHEGGEKFGYLSRREGWKKPGEKPKESGVTPEEAAARKWTKNEDGTYTAPNGMTWRKADAGGEESPVNGKPYKGGTLMPIHGQSQVKIGKSDGTGDAPDLKAGNPEDSDNPKKRKATGRKYQERTRDRMGDLVNVPEGHIAIESIVAGSPSKVGKLDDTALAYLGITKKQANDLKDIYEANDGAAYIPREIMPPSAKTTTHKRSDNWNVAEKFKEWKKQKADKAQATDAARMQEILQGEKPNP